MKKIAIIGAGISGLFIANLLKRNLNYQITVYEKSTSVELENGYGIQLSVNSIKLLNEIGFESLQNNEKFNPKKIHFYSNNSSNKICELNVSDFNSKGCKYTTLKRSSLINFLKRDLEDLILTGYNISQIEHQDQKVKLYFENNQIKECDHLIISDGIFSKSKNLISGNISKPKYNDTLAIRATLKKPPEDIDDKNISLFLASDFHHVIYPVNFSGDLNIIAIMKHQLSTDKQNNYSLFNENSFIKTVLDKTPAAFKNISNDLENLKIFPVFISDDFYEIKSDKIHLIGDAFFAFSPSFAQGASQSLEGAYELFKDIENSEERNFFKNRKRKTKMVNFRSKFNQFAFHLSNPYTTFVRNILLKRLVKNKKFLDFYLGKIYKN